MTFLCQNEQFLAKNIQKIGYIYNSTREKNQSNKFFDWFEYVSLTPTHPPTHPATRRKSFNWNWRWVKSKGTDSRPPCDYFKLIYTKLQNWLKNTLTLRTLQCLKNWLYQPEFIYKNNANFKDSIHLKFWLCGDNFNATSQLFYDFNFNFHWVEMVYIST